MAKFKLQPNPTFRAPVDISVPGEAEPARIEIEFRHLGRKAVEAYFREAAGQPDVEGLAGIIVGWDGVDTPYSPEALGQLLDAYPASALEIVEAFRGELLEAKRKN